MNTIYVFAAAGFVRESKDLAESRLASEWPDVLSASDASCKRGGNHLPFSSALSTYVPCFHPPSILFLLQPPVNHQRNRT